MGIVCRLRVVVCWICHIIQELRCERCCNVIRRYDEVHSCVRSLVWSGLVFSLSPRILRISTLLESYVTSPTITQQSQSVLCYGNISRLNHTFVVILADPPSWNEPL